MTRTDEIRERLAAVDANPVPIHGAADTSLEGHAEADIRFLLAELDAKNYTIGRLVAVGEDALHLLEALYSGDQVIWDTKSMTREDDE